MDWSEPASSLVAMVGVSILLFGTRWGRSDVLVAGIPDLSKLPAILIVATGVGALSYAAARRGGASGGDGRRGHPQSESTREEGNA